MKKVIYFILVSLTVLTSCKKDGSNPVNADTVPPIPTLANPKDTTSSIAVPVVLTWNASTGATSYTVQVSSSSSFSSFVFNKSDITTVSQQMTDLNFLSVYYWRVSATNSTGTSGWSKVWSFTTTGELPVVPQLSMPANGAVDQQLAPVLVWNQINNANKYSLQISTNSSFTSYVFYADTLTSTSKQISDLTGSTKYYWRVSATNNFGSKGWSDTWSFTTGSAAIPPVLLSPTNGALNQVLSPTLTWNASSGAIGYNLQVATNNMFSDTSLIINTNVGNFTTNQLINLNKSKTYYWKVATINNFGTSNWSSVWSFTTGEPPEAPTLQAPTNGATNQTTSPLLSWTTSTGATSYNLQVATSSSFSNSSLVVNENIGSNTNKQLSGLPNSTNYYWKVSSVNSYGSSDWSTTWSFTTIGTSPSAPTLVSPANGALDQSISPTLTWNTSTTATSYTLQVSTNNTFSSYVFNESGLTGTSQQVTGLTYSITYYWRVSASNTYGTSSYSNNRSFTTTGIAPQPPVLNTPLAGAIDQLISPTLDWAVSDGATSYTLQVSLSNSFSSFVYNLSGLTNTNQLLTSLKNSTKYYWRVMAINKYGNSNWSVTRFFSTISACANTTTVLYANKTYNTISIGGQCWLKENLDVGTMIQGTSNPSNNSAIEKYCYENNLTNCTTYGGLYQLNEALAYSNTSGTKGICPPGWHIPKQEEFQILAESVNNDGSALKEIGQGNGTNTSGFAALLAGTRSLGTGGAFVNLGNATFYWSSTYDGKDLASGLWLSGNDTIIHMSVFSSMGVGLTMGFSVRCLKD